MVNISLEKTIEVANSKNMTKHSSLLNIIDFWLFDKWIITFWACLFWSWWCECCSRYQKNSITNSIWLCSSYVKHHCMVHQTNFVVQALFKLNMVCRLENLIQTLYAHFNNGPKRHLELSKLVKIIETYGNKLSKMSKQGGFLYWNLQIRWWVNTTPHFNGQDDFGLY